jgi:hypothetical protein
MASFPTSKYARYKRATAFFLDWLLLARGRGHHSGQCGELDALGDVVKKIAAEPATALTPKLLAELPKALAACQCAITLRQHVAAPPLPVAAEGLARDAQGRNPDAGGGRGDAESEVRDYYQVLEVDEDFFPDEQLFEVDAAAPRGNFIKSAHKRVNVYQNCPQTL